MTKTTVLSIPFLLLLASSSWRNRGQGALCTAFPLRQTAAAAKTTPASRKTSNAGRRLGFVSGVFVPSSFSAPYSYSAGIARRWASSSDGNSNNDGNDDEDETVDLFDYFDPLLSPHAYPNGISPNNRKSNKNKDGSNEEGDDRYDPLRLKTFRTPKPEAPPLEEQLEDDDVDPAFVFDPTLSPHVYSRGTPDAIIGDDVDMTAKTGKTSKAAEESVVGILLMDHGSRNRQSNQRFQEMAKLYEQSQRRRQQKHKVVVRAAHMEIATPSIRDGIESLLEAGVDEIVCHPFFLSPAGRHVSEDIPRLIETAVQELDVPRTVPIRTTEAVGSSMDVMIGVIHSLVEETSAILSPSSSGGDGGRRR